MTKIRKVETYLSPKDAEQLIRLPPATLRRYVRRGVLTNYRTSGGHRRYALSELHRLFTNRQRISFQPREPLIWRWADDQDGK